VIPEPSDQIRHRRNRGATGGWPSAFDPTVYRDRNVVERAVNQLKGWRGLATRYDKHARTYRGGLVLASPTLAHAIRRRALVGLLGRTAVPLHGGGLAVSHQAGDVHGDGFG
jgi:hypothetical protein